jgi:hypothetical protein
MKKLLCLVMIATVTSAFADAPENSDQEKCHVNVDTDKGKGGTQVKICDGHAEVGFGGPIADVTWQTPLGGKDAFFPKAGRDIEGAVAQTGHNIEDGAHWVGDRLGIHF